MYRCKVYAFYRECLHPHGLARAGTVHGGSELREDNAGRLRGRLRVLQLPLQQQRQDPPNLRALFHV